VDLVASEKKFRIIVDNLADVVFTIDLEGNYTFCTPQAEKATGYTIQQLLSMNMKELIAPEHIPRVLKSLEVRSRTPAELPPIQFDIIRADGKRLPVEVKTSLLLEGDNPIGVQGIARDITERRRMEDTLRESEARFRELADLLPQIVFETDETGMLTFFNRIGLTLTGYSEEELSNGFNAFQVLPPEDARRALEKMLRVMGGEKIGADEYTLLRKDGTSFPIMIYSSAIMREGKAVGLRGIIVDMTERKQMEENLLRSKHLAAIGEAAAMVGHDLRNPLQATTSTLYLAKKLLGSGRTDERDEALGLLEELDNQVYYMNKVVSDLQDYAKPVDAELTETDLPELIKEVISNLKFPPTVQVSTELDEDLTRIMANEVLMKRVLVNLIMNAIQAMPKGGKLTITANNTQNSAAIAVQDTGIGISAENMEKIFSPFFTTKAQGQGLGLAVCKRLIDAQGGTITVKSELGKGSTFTVKLPSIVPAHEKVQHITIQ